LGVFCAYATAQGRALVDRELCVPKSWTTDRARCREPTVPDEVEFATKPVLARRMLARALDAGVPAGWKRRSCGKGAKGPRLFDWTVADLPVYADTTPPGWQRWLLARRPLTRNSQGEYEPR
jgi:SRSO17 transposase